MNDFEGAMLKVLSENHVLGASPAQQLNMDEGNNVIIFERNNLIFLFNFHVDSSIPNYEFSVPKPGKYEAILISDDLQYGGHGRIDSEVTYVSKEAEDKSHKLKVYLTSRTALVLKLVD